MSLVPSFLELLQPLSVAMTCPTFDSFVTVLTGWVFARRRTVTGMILAADAVGDGPGRGASTTRRTTGCSPPHAGRWTNWGWRCSGCWC